MEPTRDHADEDGATNATDTTRERPNMQEITMSYRRSVSLASSRADAIRRPGSHIAICLTPAGPCAQISTPSERIAIGLGAIAFGGLVMIAASRSEATS